MNGSHVLLIMGLMLMTLGGVGVGIQLHNDAAPVMWLGAIGPIVMGVALVIISRAIRRDKQ
ncbi:MAG: hypothetical protein AAGJ52_02125 [Pseudomonadota bacterium]